MGMQHDRHAQCRARWVLGIAFSTIFSGATASAGVVQGTLCTSVGDSITSDQLRDWID